MYIYILQRSVYMLGATRCIKRLELWMPGTSPHIHMYVQIYLNLYIYIYIYVYIHVYVYVRDESAQRYCHNQWQGKARLARPETHQIAWAIQQHISIEFKVSNPLQ